MHNSSPKVVDTVIHSSSFGSHTEYFSPPERSHCNRAIQSRPVQRCVDYHIAQDAESFGLSFDDSMVCIIAIIKTL